MEDVQDVECQATERKKGVGTSCLESWAVAFQGKAV